MGGPKTKEENLEATKLIGETLFIGDSVKDYEVAINYGFDFIFVYGYTIRYLAKFFNDKNILLSIKNFDDLVNL